VVSVGLKISVKGLYPHEIENVLNAISKVFSIKDIHITKRGFKSRRWF